MNDDTGPDSPSIRAVIFDWAGTTVDFGSFAPTAALVEASRRAGVPITEAEARGPMGRNERDHLRDLLNDPGIRTRWTAARNADPDESDIDDLYRAFLPLQEEYLGGNQRRTQRGHVDRRGRGVGQRQRSFARVVDATRRPTEG